MGNRSTEEIKKDIWNVKREMEHNMFREKLIWKLVREEYRVNIKFSFTFIYGFYWFVRFLNNTFDKVLTCCLYPVLMLIWSRWESGSSV